MLEEQNELREGWIWTSIKEVILDAQTGFASGEKGILDGIPHLRMNNIGSDCRLNLESVLTVPKELAKPQYILKADDVLVCHTNSVKLVGKTAVFNLTNGRYAFSNHLTRLRVNPDLITPQWLRYVLATLWRERYFEIRCKQWVNQATIERETLLAAPVPLPPLAEQQRIVARMEQLLAHRDTARVALDSLPPLLKKIRQRILADAFAGRLTQRCPTDEPASILLERIQAERRQRWEETLRAQGKDPAKAKYEAPAPPDVSDLPELPEGWVWVSLGQWFDLERGRFSVRPRNDPRFYEGKYPFVQIGDLPKDGGEIKQFSQTLNEAGFRISKMFPKGTVLIAIVGATIANTGVLTFDSCCPDSLVAIRSDDEIQLKFVDFYLRSKKFDIRSESYASGGQPNISLKTLFPYPAPCPPLAEQQRIVARIESLFAQVEVIETAVKVARRRVEQAEQAVLSRAFRGELVAQDPNDEPASALLERIKIGSGG